MDELINRAALLSRIDAERKHLLDLKMDGAEHIIVHHARRIIEDLPSITPSYNSIKTELDCVSREDAINLVHDLAQPCDDSYDWDISADDMIDGIKELPSVTPKASWIPVSERLPTENGRYLVTRGLNACGAIWNRTYIINYSDLMGLKSERVWWDGNVGKSDFKQIEDVLAWQPLPQPYKAESEDKK